MTQHTDRQIRLDSLRATWPQLTEEELLEADHNLMAFFQWVLECADSDGVTTSAPLTENAPTPRMKVCDKGE